MSTNLLPTLIVACLFIVSLLIRWKRWAPSDRTLKSISAGAHAASAILQILIVRVVYGYGDMLGYHARGQWISSLLRHDLGAFLPEVIDLIFVRDASPMLVQVAIGGDATISMTGITGLLCFALGDSLVAICLFIAMLSFFSKDLLFEAIGSRVDTRFRRPVLVAVMLVPSAVFWSSALLKEGIAMSGLGPLLYGSWALLERGSGTRVKHAMLVGVGAILVLLVKPYIMFAFLCALAVWLYWNRVIASSRDRMVRIRPAYLLLAIGLGTVGLVLLGEAFPAYALEHLEEETASLQEVGARIEGGSNYQLAESPGRGVAAQLAYAPVALLTALFRPALFDVRNGMMLINALETTAIAFFFLRGMRRISARSVWRRLRSSPIASFCATFTLLFGTAVGLATTNFGSLSRYRIPMIPFFAVLVVLVTMQVSRGRAPTVRRTVRRGNVLERG